MNERRTKQRDLCSDIVELFWSDEDRWPHRITVLLEDISACGACVQTEAPVPLFVEVALRLGDLGFAGEVRYCTLVDSNYLVGVEFTEGHRWSKVDYDPKHILELPMVEDERATLERSELLNHGSSG